MNFIILDHRWNQHCQNFWQTSHWQNYVLNARFGVEYKNHSFMIEQSGEIIGLVPLIQENDQFTFQGGPTPEFICKPEHEKYVLEEIKRIAGENGVKRIHIKGHIKGYLDCSAYACIINPNETDPTKGHRAAIKKAENYLTYSIEPYLGTFQEDYYRIAGKVTRPQTTFDILDKWLENGIGILLTAKLGEMVAGYVYILRWKDCAYYFMSCVEPDCKCYNVTHFLLWKVFELLRDIGVKKIELGEQTYPSLFCQPTDKEKNISLFKKGFGGQIVLNPASEYFFDKDYMRQAYVERINNYIRHEYEQKTEKDY